jgi:predicted negative regulator of RcsB-dependent stress response
MNPSVHNFLNSLQSDKNLRYLGLLAGAVVIGVVVWGGYYLYSSKKAEEAQYALSQAVSEYEKALQGDGKDTRWDEVVHGFQTAYDRYSSTWAGPYLLAYKAQALLHNNNYAEALPAMTTSVASMKKSAPLYYFFATSLALMKADSTDEKIKAAGLKELDDLGENHRNPERERALYYSGLYASQAGDKQKAASVWRVLAQRGAAESPWVLLAEKKLT